MARTSARASLPAAPDGRDTRTRIVEEAAALFLERGYEGTSVGAIAKAVGISPPALYWHFESKDQIAAAFLENALEDFIAAIDAAIVGQSAVAQLHEFAFAHVAWQLDPGKLGRAYRGVYGFGTLRSHLGEEERTRVVELNRRYLDRVKEILLRGAREEGFVVADVSVAAMMIVTMCEYSISWYLHRGPLGIAQVAEMHADAAVRMVGRDPADR